MKPVRAMILAAGRGERMRPLTDRTPKPLLPVGGKPLIVWHIERLAAAGFSELVINVAHHGAQIMEALGNGSCWGVNIRYSDEGEGQALETGGGIYRALPLLGAEPFLVVNGDVFTDIEYSHLNLPAEKLSHLVLVDNPEHHPEGDFCLHEGDLIQHCDVRLTFSGVGIYHPEFFKHCHPGKFPLGPMLREAITAGKVTGEYHQGEWMDVGTPERLAELDARHT